ncbi:MAG: hypothetical protein HY722_08325 [Planctomycetes bacterium]|nr:hypothetical protein [Planctomycetota bacterium]
MTRLREAADVHDSFEHLAHRDEADHARWVEMTHRRLLRRATGPVVLAVLLSLALVVPPAVGAAMDLLEGRHAWPQAAGRPPGGVPVLLVTDPAMLASLRAQGLDVPYAPAPSRR